MNRSLLRMSPLFLSLFLFGTLGMAQAQDHTKEKERPKEQTYTTEFPLRVDFRVWNDHPVAADQIERRRGPVDLRVLPIRSAETPLTRYSLQDGKYTVALRARRVTDDRILLEVFLFDRDGERIAMQTQSVTDLREANIDLELFGGRGVARRLGLNPMEIRISGINYLQRLDPSGGLTPALPLIRPVAR